MSGFKFVSDLNVTGPASEDFTSKYIIIPSGSFSGYAHSISTSNFDEASYYGENYSEANELYLFNPMKIPSVQVDENVLAQDSPAAAAELVKQFKESDTAYIKESDVAAYADKIVLLGANIELFNPKCVIAPLRGALKPSLFLKTMNALPVGIDWLPFTKASSGEHDKELAERLKKIIDRRFSRDLGMFPIAVVDTAKGGQGLTKLTSLFLQVRDQYPNLPVWQVRYFVIHAKGADMGNIMSVQSQTRHNSIAFVVERYEVNDLLVEDWDAAIGIKIEYKGGSITIKNSLTQGRLILHGSDSILVVESEEMSKYVDVLIAKQISDSIITNPALTHVGDVWQSYALR